MSASLPFRGVSVARDLVAPPEEAAPEGWNLEALAGRLVEVSGGPSTSVLTLGAVLVHEAQCRGGWAAWIGGRGSTFFPPDFAASGIDLEALPVVRVSDVGEAARAADTLVRCGGFRVVVLDLGPGGDLPLPVQTRLVGLAKRHRTAIVTLTRSGRDGRSRGSLASLRGEATRRRADPDCFVCELRAVKDKRRGPGWSHAEICRGTDGLC